MRYRIGLDLGSTSIGWCLVRLDTNDRPVGLIRMGVRIFSDGRNPKDGSSLAVTRRLARQMRRRRDRLIKRKERLLAALIRLGFLPSEETQRKELVKLDPYVLRQKGLHEALTGAEFGRALFHINQRRGFLSNRRTDKNDNDQSILKSAISELRTKLQDEGCQTLGEWLAKRHASNLSVRARLRGKTKKEKAYDFYADRAMVAAEFDMLWLKQKELNPGLFNDAARDELKDILLFQRPLKPVKPGRCTLIPDEARAPRALPTAQRFRIYQEVNNLRIIGADQRECPLSLEQRDAVVALLERGDAPFSKIGKALKLPGTTTFNLEDIKRDRLIGNRATSILSKQDYFGALWETFDYRLQDDIVDRLLNESSESVLIDWLQKSFEIDEDVAERIANVSLPEGYGNLSRAALALVMPELIGNVVPYSEAVERSGLGSHSAISHSERTGELMEQLPYYGEVLQRHVGFGSGALSDQPERRFGRIANPTVHIGLNQVRRVVNKLIRRYGHPSEIIIEIARDLKLGRERKLEIQRDQLERQTKNALRIEEACRALNLTADNLDRGKRREISQKMQLWEELNPKDVTARRCPYTGEQISIGRLLSDAVEIEHILPYSVTLDDSLNNKTVAMRRANRDKGNRTPHAAFGEQPVAGYDYDAILERSALMPREKAKRFAPDGYQRWLRDDKDFLARALNDTAYLSRVTKEYLSLICPPNKVRCIPGRMTALLRGKFGLNSLLSETGQKSRDDHRHHAVDAAVIAVTDQGLLQRFAVASASARENQLHRLVDEVPLPWPTYRDHVCRALSHIVVSYKPDHGYQGAMHEETAWGLRDDGKVTRRILDESSGSPERRREYLQKRVVPIASTRDPEHHGNSECGVSRPYKGYVGGSNYCIEIWRDDRGKWNGDVVSTYDAYQVVRRYGAADGFRRLRDPLLSQAGKQLVMRLMLSDLIKAKFGDETRIMRVATISANGQIFMCEHNEANVDARNRNRDDPFKYVSKTPGALRKASGRRVIVSEIGDVRDPGFRD